MKVNNLFKPMYLLPALLLAAGTSFAGTPLLSGAYTGTYDLTMRQAATGYQLGTSVSSFNWSLVLTGSTSTPGTLSITPGQLDATPPPGSGIPPGTFNYAATAVGSGGATFTLPLVDNGDGTYTATYDFQIFNPLQGNPKASTYTKFEITDLGGNQIEAKTIPSDETSIPGTTIPGAPATGFPQPIKPAWDGTAQK